jgi:peptidyl-prolyl cis-trans isomerase C
MLFLAVLLLTAGSPAGLAAATLQAGAPATPGQATPQPETAAPAVAAQLPDIVARVNGQAINKAELEAAVAQVEARAGRPIPAEQRDSIVRGVLNQLIAYRLLVQETVARKIVVSDADLDQQIAAIRKQFPSEEVFQQALDRRKMTMERLRTDTRDSLKIDKMVAAEAAAKGEITSQQVADFYAANPEEFQQKERARASHILIRYPPNNPTAKEQARAHAAGVLAELKAGKDFATLAKEHSQDPVSAAKGGDLGYFERGQLVAPFEEAAFSLPLAQLSELVETPFGYHIVRVVERQQARTVPLEEARGAIERFLRGEQRQRETQALIESLKAKGKIDIYI